MKKLKFLQFSDLHIGSKMSSSNLNLAKKTEKRKQEMRDTFKKICQLARKEHVDVVLVPGDLWDDETTSIDNLNFVREHLTMPIPVFITPGNHDFYSKTSFYDDVYLDSQELSPWPENVVIFRQNEFTTLPMKGRQDVLVTGIAFYENVYADTRRLDNPISISRDFINIFMFHGSREGYAPSEDKITMPFSDKELLDQGFDYAAIGHYHTFSEIKDKDGVVRAAYSGAPFGRGLDETGEKCILIGTIEKKDGKSIVAIEKKVCDKRCIRNITVDITGLTHFDAVCDRIEAEVSEKSNADDIIYCQLCGLVAKGVELRFPDGFLESQYFHVKIDSDNVRPDYDLGKYRREVSKNTTESKYVSQLQLMEEKAKSEREKRIIRNAIYYGLDALVSGTIDRKYEN